MPHCCHARPAAATHWPAPSLRRLLKAHFARLAGLQLPIHVAQLKEATNFSELVSGARLISLRMLRLADPAWRPCGRLPAAHLRRLPTVGAARCAAAALAVRLAVLLPCQTARTLGCHFGALTTRVPRAALQPTPG